MQYQIVYTKQYENIYKHQTLLYNDNMYCKCGCGKITPIAKRNRYNLGHIKGKYIDYLLGHKMRGKKRVFSDKWKKNISKGCMGRTPWNKGKKWNEKVLQKLRGKRDNILGEKNPNWKGGIDQQIRGIRRSRDYLRFKKFIRDRDRVCILCGSDKKLHIDHIKSFTYYPELRYEPSNARLLCFKCHRETPNFGSKARMEVG